MSGRYYVSAKNDAGRFALVSGPYDSHERALALVGRAAVLADDEWSGAWFFRWGTCLVHCGASGEAFPLGALQRIGWDAELRERAPEVRT